MCLNRDKLSFIIFFNFRSPLSSLVFGTNALITKPAISLSPLITLAILEAYGYKELQSEAVPPSNNLVDLHIAMFNMLCVSPFVTGILQLLVWSFYRLRQTHTVIASHVES